MCTVCVCGLYDRVTQEHKLLASYGPYAEVTLLVQSGHAHAELEAHVAAAFKITTASARVTAAEDGGDVVSGSPCISLQH